MKKIAVVLLSVLFLASCVKDDTITREDYIGEWTCQESSANLGNSTYRVHIKEGSGADKLIMENIYNYGFGVSAVLTVSEDNITIASQKIQNDQISGSGTMTDNNKISLSFSVTDTTGTDNVTATLIKQ